ncbi:MAG: bacteriocin [Actinomycetota bacterium]|nr:MAG: bacteriocin [Actinomycetota bacterium]
MTHGEHLLRGHAPITAAGWSAIDDEARARLVPRLAVRRLVDFAGPHGWTFSSVGLGQVRSLPAAQDGVRAAVRVVAPAVELRVAFSVRRATLDDIDRGANAPDLEEIDVAAERMALAENRAVLLGWAEAGVTGIVRASSQPPVSLGASPQEYPVAVATAVNQLQDSGIGGPYALAVDPAGYTSITESTESGGYLLDKHLERILGGPVVRTPGLTGGVVLSQRGGDFRFDSGQDLSVGYSGHDVDAVQLYLEQSFAFRVTEPAAAVALV